MNGLNMDGRYNKIHQNYFDFISQDTAENRINDNKAQEEIN